MCTIQYGKKLSDSLGGAMFCANRNFYQNSWRNQQGKHDTYQGRWKVLKYGGAYTRCFEPTSFFLYLKKSGNAWALTSHSAGHWSAVLRGAVQKLRYHNNLVIVGQPKANLVRRTKQMIKWHYGASSGFPCNIHGKGL